MKKLIISLLALIIFTGCSLQKPAEEKKLDDQKENEIIGSTVSVCDLVASPKKYVDKKVEVKALLQSDGAENFLLADNDCQIPVENWLPTTVAQCAPTMKDCQAPDIMNTFLNKEVELSGILKEVPKREYIDKKWQVTGSYYIFSVTENKK
ncbi:MAG TPA: hypothetical protein PKI61_03225 [bacterium]|nr:hypothetical protein [bacterium]HPT30059.1 hypothetical protein [bacterium]